MARKRRGKTQRKSRKKQPVSITKLAETLIVSNASTRTLFGTNLDHFLFDGWLPFGDYKDGMVLGEDGGSGNSWALSAKEIVEGVLGIGDGFRMHHTLSYSDRPNTIGGMFDTIGNNFQRYAPSQLPVILLTPVAFKFGKKLMRKPINLTNKGIKMLGLGKDIRV